MHKDASLHFLHNDVTGFYSTILLSFYCFRNEQIKQLNMTNDGLVSEKSRMKVIETQHCVNL